MSTFDAFAELLAGRVPEEHRQELVRYGCFVLEENQKFNLTGAKSPAEFAPHIIDSVAVAPYAEGSLVDVGSGGGLPAIPIAIVRRIPVVMIESTGKKVRFLERMLREFGLEGAAIAARAEIAAHDRHLREQFRTGTARAVSSAPTVAELVLPLIAVGGRALLQRGETDAREMQALEDASLVLGGRVERVIEDMPTGRLVIVEKTAPTQLRFPRRTGVPEKRPLCL